MSVTVYVLQRSNANLSTAVMACKIFEAKFEETDINISQISKFQKDTNKK